MNDNFSWLASLTHEEIQMDVRFSKCIDAFTVRVPPELKNAAEGLAALRGVSLPELIRNLIETEIEKERARYEALKTIFDHSDVK